MKAIIGQFYKTLDKAVKRAKEQKKMWNGRIAFIVVGCEGGYMVISETAARVCGFYVPLTARKLSTGGRLTPQRIKSNI